jgi:hypothetical protein
MDRSRREVHWRFVVEARTQEGVDVGMRRAALAAVLVDGKGALDAPGRPVEGVPHGVAQDALRRAPVDPGKALGRAVVDREDETEVDRVPEAAAVIHQGLTDRLLVAAKRLYGSPMP